MATFLFFNVKTVYEMKVHFFLGLCMIKKTCYTVLKCQFNAKITAKALG